MTLPWVALLDTVGNIADDLITTDEERQKLALQDKAMDISLQQGQIDTNKVEAAHASTFVAGWRPFAGWVCGVSLGMVYIPKAAVMTGIWAYQAWVISSAWSGTGAPPVVPPFPDLGVTDLIGLLMALLGLGVLRQRDKEAGTATAAVGTPRG